ncbi:MAG: T9SS type A sorting domain-containing protein [Candidatus Marinimicrobia bacterium]|nr:T9SS type A sorting domain-containing protein [Candidatus Neomarinimicrobiota bacterium]
MQILIIILLSTLTAFGQVDLTISTNRIEYSLSDTIHITLEAKNNGSLAVELPIETDCESAYFIGDWFSLDDTSLACLTNRHNLLIESDAIVSWSWDYFIEDHPENVGNIALNGVLFLTYEPPLFSELLFIQIGETDTSQLVSGFMPSVDTLRIEGGCVIPELLLEPDSGNMDYQKIVFSDAGEGFSINLRPRTDWDNYMNSTFFWVRHDSIPFSYSASLETVWDTVDFPIGESRWLDDGLLKIFILQEGSIIDSIAQLINVHVTGAVEAKNIMHSNLLTAYPNPFNPSTIIEYNLPAYSNVSLVIYDVAGRAVNTLFSTSQGPGSYKVRWNGKNKDGHQVAGGLYFARLHAGEYSSVVKIVYL